MLSSRFLDEKHAFVEISFPQGFIFTKDVFLFQVSLLRLFDMEGLFVVISSLSFDYLAWGGAIDCLFYIFLCSLLDAISGTFLAFISHFTSFVAQHASFTPISHGGERSSR
jgi:hypothetical protein